MKRNEQLSYLLAVIAILLWSTVATAFKLGLAVFSSFDLIFYACFTSVVVLGLLSVYKHKGKLIEGIKGRKNLSLTISQALLNPFLYYIFLFGAYSNLPAQIAQPVNFTWPIFLSLFAIVFLKRPFSVRTFPALILSFSGVLILSIKNNVGEYSGSNYKTGIAYGLLSAIIWAAYWIVNMKDSRFALIKLFWSFLFAFVFINIYGLFTNQIPMLPDFNKLVAPVYIGLFEMSLTFFIWMLALEKAKNTALLSNMVYIVPILSLGVIRVILKEQIETTTYFGLALIIFGVLIQAKPARKRRYSEKLNTIRPKYGKQNNI